MPHMRHLDYEAVVHQLFTSFGIGGNGGYGTSPTANNHVPPGPKGGDPLTNAVLDEYDSEPPPVEPVHDTVDANTR